MLPFLKKNQEASIAVPAEAVTRDSDEEPEYDSMESAAEDLISAVHSKDVKGVCAALRAAFDLSKEGDSA